MSPLDFMRRKRATPDFTPAVENRVVRLDYTPRKMRGAIGRMTDSVKSFTRMVFGSADANRLTGDWSTNPVPADWVIHKHQRTLVARSREAQHNNDHFKAYIRLCRQNIVGHHGVRFQSKAKTAAGKIDKTAKSAIEAAFADWCERDNCDVTGKKSFRAFQAAAVRAAVVGGEFMFRIITGADAGKYGFALQQLDPVRCPVDYDVMGLANGAFIRHGIEFNQYGKPVAFHFIQPTAQRSNDAYSYAGRSFLRIPAEEIIHGFLDEMEGQKRGLPWLATGLFRIKQMGAFEDAAVVNARIGAAKVGVIEFAEGTGPECNDLDDDEEFMLDAEPGTFPVLPNGAKLNKFDPAYPSGEFAVFMKAMLRSMAVGGGVSYHNLSGDLEGVNFSSIRQGTLDEREHFKELQEWLIDEFIKPVFAAWFNSVMLRGKIKRDNGMPLPFARLDALSAGEWQGRRWEWIDPNADMNAAQGRKNNLLASPGALIRESGRDPAVVWQEIGDDIKAMKAAGIPMEIIEMSMGQMVTESKTGTMGADGELVDPPKPEDKPAPKESK